MTYQIINGGMNENKYQWTNIEWQQEIPVSQNQQQKKQMAAGKSLSASTNNPKNKLLYLECQWKPHKSIKVDLKLSKPENI